jgi:dephospho-CoA kinase
MLRIVGLSGGIACGKSTVAAIIRIQGYPVVDADRLARDVVAKGQPVLQQIVDYFGDAILTDNGELDWRELG